jgi:hypothetical protein
MRDAMPGCAALVDDLRAAFGVAEVDQWIRDGLRDGTFHAVEGNHQIGKPQPRDGYVHAHMPEDFHGSLPASAHCERKAREIALATKRGDWLKQVKR